ncbi:glycoside hydrolase family 2 [Actinomyces sp. B33]|uniref:glycoside hydrolase family 2 protein n=1 Tax=Actinomyces sp. B33 TaxID=2942131 RepID=UPI0023408769|nr:glycoside hydrolase family 2 TIM barrel-domain containing protein [Actinomyces sp. B33]MDC4233297.1 glycoside hydrolase family 2 [Actinomyces sp. B33]
MTQATTLASPWAPSPTDTPLAEYPRPMLRRDQWESLNGQWDYAIVPGAADAASPDPLPIDQWDGTILVPFAVETAASGVQRPLTPADVLVYERTVALPRHWRGRRIAITFEAVDYHARVWIDGSLVVAHTGGYLPFTAEIPDTRRDRVRLRVEVTDPTDTGMQQRGKQALSSETIWYTPTSGIWQSVWMEPLPAAALTRVAARAHDDLETLTLLVSSDGPPADATVRIHRRSHDDVVAVVRTGRPADVVIPGARTWSPDDPHLYPVTVTTADDETSSYIAVRTVAISDPDPRRPGIRRRKSGQGRHILLNGRPLLVNAPLQQGYWPESGMTAPHEDALVHDMRTMKEMGFNGVRVHIKVESRRFYHLADRMGMVLVQDAVSGAKAPLGIKLSGVIQGLDITSPDRSRFFAWRTGRSKASDRAEFLHDWIATIHHLEAHPSILVWVPFNEGWGQFDARRVADLTRRTDPTRLVDAASGWFDQGHDCGDFRSRHRYVLALKPPTQRDPRPYYLSEFGGFNLAVDGHLWSPGTAFGYRFLPDANALAEALADLYRTQLLRLVRKGLTASTYTQVSDVEQETNGLMTYDRRVTKVDPAFMRGLNEEVYAAFARAHPAL